MTLRCLVCGRVCAARRGLCVGQDDVRDRIGMIPGIRTSSLGRRDPATARSSRPAREPLDADTAVRIALLQNPHCKRIPSLGAPGDLVARASVRPPSCMARRLPRGRCGAPSRLGDREPHRADRAAPASRRASLRLPARRPGLLRTRSTCRADAPAFYGPGAGQRSARAWFVVGPRLTAECRSSLGGQRDPTSSSRSPNIRGDAQLTAGDAELRVVERRAELWQWLGGPASPGSLRVEPTLPAASASLPALAELEQKALAQSLDLAWLRAEDARLERAKTSATWTGGLPDLRAGVHFERDHGEWEMGPTASLSLPLFDRGQGAFGIAEASQRGLYYERRARTLSVRAAASSLRARLEVAANRVKRYDEQLCRCEERSSPDAAPVQRDADRGRAAADGAQSELESRREHVVRSAATAAAERARPAAGGRLMDASARRGKLSCGCWRAGGRGGGH